MEFSGKTVVILGGGIGVGLEMAKSFARDGASVFITGRNIEEAAKANANITPHDCDVSKDEDMVKFRDDMEAKGGVDFLINNAGNIRIFDIKDSSSDIIQEYQQVNIDINGVIRGVHYFLPMLLKKDSAHIMNVTSALAYVPWAATPVYSATMAFVHSYTQSLRKQLEDTNVTVLECLPPMLVESTPPMTTTASDSETTTLDGQSGWFVKMPTTEFMAEFRKALDKGQQQEIAPGQSIRLAITSRFAPGLILGRVNNGYENYLPKREGEEATTKTEEKTAASDEPSAKEEEQKDSTGDAADKEEDRD